MICSLSSIEKRLNLRSDSQEFEVPVLTKHPHTESPALPAFRDDSEPNIQFSPADQSVFPLPGDDTNDTSASKVSLRHLSRDVSNFRLSCVFAGVHRSVRAGALSGSA